MTEQKTSTIAELNDRFRQSIGAMVRPEDEVPGRIVATSGIASLKYEVQIEILFAVRDFADFTGDNDPHGEHDFGAITIGRERIFWKIDYYEDNALQFGAEDPSNPERSFRVLTIMPASEY